MIGEKIQKKMNKNLTESLYKLTNNFMSFQISLKIFFKFIICKMKVNHKYKINKIRSKFKKLKLLIIRNKNYNQMRMMIIKIKSQIISMKLVINNLIRYQNKMFSQVFRLQLQINLSLI